MMKIRMSKEKEALLSKVQQVAYNCEKRGGGGCARCVLLAIQEVLGLGNSSVVKAATGLVGGINRMGLVCGALTGGALALGLKYGLDCSSSEDPESFRKVYPIPAVQELVEGFKKKFGSAMCPKITGIDLNNEEQHASWNQSGGNEKCCKLIGETARMVAELLISDDFE